MAPIKIKIPKDFEMIEARMRRLMESMFGPWSEPVPSEVGGFQPAADIYETPAGLVIRLELAGVKLEDISLLLHQRELVINGRRRFPAAEPVQRFYRLEIDYGRFERRFLLPKPVAEELVTAEYQNGVLEIRLPWRPPATPQRIVVREES